MGIKLIWGPTARWGRGACKYFMDYLTNGRQCWSVRRIHCQERDLQPGPAQIRADQGHRLSAALANLFGVEDSSEFDPVLSCGPNTNDVSGGRVNLQAGWSTERSKGTALIVLPHIKLEDVRGKWQLIKKKRHHAGTYQRLIGEFVLVLMVRNAK